MEMLDIVKLGEFARRRPNQLSGGQQQRVALARALVNMPSALLLDEPLAALDLKLREAMQLELKRIQREVGITFIFVTHDQHEALTMSDRIAVMSRGRVEQIGTPEEIYGKPSSVFVAGFIGSANLLPGSVADCVERVDLDAGATVDGAVDRRRRGRRPGHGHDPTGAAQRRHRRRRAAQCRRHGQRRDLRGFLDPSDRPPARQHRADGDGRRRRRPAAARTRAAAITLTWAADAPFVLQGRSTIVGVDHHRRRRGPGRARRQGRRRADGADDASAPSRFGRRALIVGGSLVGAAAVVAGVLRVTGDGGGQNAQGRARGGTLGGNGTLGAGETDVRILNWQAYIDPTEDGAIGTRRPVRRGLR